MGTLLSGPDNDVDFTPDGSFNTYHNFASLSPSINVFPPLSTTSFLRDSALGCKRKELPPESERNLILYLSFVRALCVSPGSFFLEELRRKKQREKDWWEKEPGVEN